ncbi:MAG: hypothetical protein V1827_04295 [Candidatus Micrarchaeota archaeon]
MEVLLPLLLSLPPAAGAAIAISVGLSVLIVGVMFMFSYALQMPEMVALAREELASLLLTVFIIIFFLGSDQLLNTIVNGILMMSLPASHQGYISSATGSITHSHLDLALGTLGLIIQKLKAQYIDLYLFEILIGFLSTISFPLGSPIPATNVISFSVAPFGGLGLLSNAHTVIVEAIGYSISLLWAEEFLLQFSRDAVPLVIFPVGLAMRAVPFFRRTGSSLIALCFAMYFIFPFSVIFTNYLIFDAFHPVDFVYTPSTASYFETTRDVSGDVTSGYNDRTTDLMSQFFSPSVVGEASKQASSPCAGNAMSKAMCSVTNVATSLLDAAKGLASTIWNIWKFMVGMTGDFFFTGFNNPLMFGSASSGLFYFIIKEVATISPFIILLMFTTLLEVIITITGYRSISMLIGGEAELTGITKVI